MGEPTALDLAEESFAAEQYADAERHYLRALLEEDPTDGVADRWFFSRGARAVEDARAVVRAYPESSVAWRLLVRVLLREREYGQAVDGAGAAIGRFEGPERARFVHLRFEAAVRGAQTRPPDWRQLRMDLGEVWSAWTRPVDEDRQAAAHRVQRGIIRRLLGISTAPAVALLRDFAAEIEPGHPHHARVLRSHAETIVLFDPP